MKNSEIQSLQTRVLLSGASSLSEPELLGLVLKSPALARSVIYGSQNWPRTRESDIARVPHIRKTRIAQILALLELSRRLAAEPLNLGTSIRCSEDVATRYKSKLQHREREEFWALALDNKNRVIAESLVARGSLTGVEAHPRECFRRLVEVGAARAIFLHNHPSGVPTPSASDRSVAVRLKETGEILGIPLLDFIVIAASGTLSFRDTGIITPSQSLLGG